MSVNGPGVRPGRVLRAAVAARRQDVADGDPERDLTAEARCPYLLGTGDRTCKSGCWTEPSCVTDAPALGWPKPWQIGDYKRRTHRRRTTNGRWRW